MRHRHARAASCAEYAPAYGAPQWYLCGISWSCCTAVSRTIPRHYNSPMLRRSGDVVRPQQWAARRSHNSSRWRRPQGHTTGVGTCPYIHPVRMGTHFGLNPTRVCLPSNLAIDVYHEVRTHLASRTHRTNTSIGTKDPIRCIKIPNKELAR
jgi:hypothetical protein